MPVPVELVHLQFIGKVVGGFVIAVTSSDEKKKLCLELGADVVVDANAEDMNAALRAANNGKSVDLVLEMVGGKTFDQSLEALAMFGRIVIYGMASRRMPTPVHPATLMGKSKTIAGFWLVNCLGKKELMQDVFVELFGLIISGKLKPVVARLIRCRKRWKPTKRCWPAKQWAKIVLNPAL